MKLDLEPDSLAGQWMEATRKIDENILETDNCLFNKFLMYETETFREIREGLEVLQKISRKFLHEKLQLMEDSDKEESNVGERIFISTKQLIV